MKIIAKTIHNDFITFNDVLALNYDSSLEVPCDSLNVVIPCISCEHEFCQITAVFNNVTFFTGIVDQQIFQASSNGNTLSFFCRSFTALMIDNEARPATYIQLSSSDLFSRYAFKFGINSFNFPHHSTQNFVQVKKGMSCYEVITDFCKKSYGKVPFLTQENSLSLFFGQNSVDFSNSFFNSEVHHNHYNIISKIYVKTDKLNYAHSVENPYAVSRGITRERYSTSGLFDNSSSFHIKLDIDGYFKCSIGDMAIGAYHENLIIYNKKISVSSNGIITTVILKRM